MEPAKYCVGGSEGLCFEYSSDSKDDRSRALDAALKAAKRGDPILSCSSFKSRKRKLVSSKEVCYIERRKQPTNLTLGLFAGLAFVVATRKRKA